MRYAFMLFAVIGVMSLRSNPTSKQQRRLLDNPLEDTISTVKIGRQVWMKYNLSTTTFRDGSAIAPFLNTSELNQLEDQGLAGYGMVPDQQEEMLYNHFAAADPRNICPEGFKVPSLLDFLELIDTLNTAQYKSLGDLEQRLIHQGGNGFGARYSGWCCMDYTDEEGQVHDFVNGGSNAAFWTVTDGEEEGFACSLEIGESWRNDSEGVFYDCYSPRKYAFSVRCIRE